ncbi:endonuclease domain-containing protein [Streptomyces sp. NRRL S-244]|uniref:endonuclease domain-containing protein n=1 Tax=Streptomyces sp. NRRL S-244 TaxID=1463897 RepID=UPI000997CBBE|nr:endonuclease domain-containing protein [Streptomyces sp. NRRL S-244]
MVGDGQAGAERSRAPDAVSRSRVGRSLPQVDHRRRTGRVRGVLCINCDSGLGVLKDNPDRTSGRRIFGGNAWKPTLVARGGCRQPS